MKYSVSYVIRKPLDIQLLEVQSFEMNVYLVKISVNNIEGFVFNDNDQPMRFHSAQQIRETFVHCRVDKAIMVHDTPYDEMIGNPPKAPVSAALPFSMQLPY